jgi:hypothetical protein
MLTRPIVDAEDGAIVHIAGSVVAGKRTLTGPLSGRECVAYELTVVSVGSGMMPDTVIARETRTARFVLKDSTGRARVRGATSVGRDGIAEFWTTSGVFDAVDGVEAKILARHGIDPKGAMGMNRELMFREHALEPGRNVTLVGRARWVEQARRPSVDGGYRESASVKRLVIEALEDGLVQVLDDPRAR